MPWRPVDLTLRVDPWSSGPLKPHPLPDYLEPTGPGHPRQFVQRICHTLPYAFATNEIGVDVYLGDSLPHTHAESLLVNRVTIRGEIPESRRWAVRDVASVPAAEWVREAAVVDISPLDPSKPAPLNAFKEAAKHVQWGDFVILKTSSQGQITSVDEDIARLEAPGMLPEVAQWLVEEKGIVGIMSDAVYDPVKKDYGRVGAAVGTVHTYFYTNAVLMIDAGVNFDQLASGRVFLNGALCLRTSGIASCPTRTMVLVGDEDDLAKRKPLDMFTRMKAYSGRGTNTPITRLEPLELQSEIYKRYEIFGLQIAADPTVEAQKGLGSEVRPQRDFGSPIRLFNSHLGTHLQLPVALAGSAKAGDLVVTRSHFPSSSDLFGASVLLDLTQYGPGQLVTLGAVQHAAHQAGGVASGDIVVLWTGFSDRYYARPDFLQWSPLFDPGALEWLIAQGTKMMVTDAARLEPYPWKDHLPPVCGQLLAERRIPSVVLVTNLWRLRKPRATLFCSPVPLEGLPSSPARVVVVEDWRRECQG